MPFNLLRFVSQGYASLESLLKAKWQRIRPPKTHAISTHVYEIRLRADHRGVELISNAFPFGRLWPRFITQSEMLSAGGRHCSIDEADYVLTL